MILLLGKINTLNVRNRLSCEVWILNVLISEFYWKTLKSLMYAVFRVL